MIWQLTDLRNTNTSNNYQSFIKEGLKAYFHQYLKCNSTHVTGHSKH